jgi:hypothetical protein
MKTYDLVVLGSGTAAQVASARVQKAGRTVALEANFGSIGPNSWPPKELLLIRCPRIVVVFFLWFQRSTRWVSSRHRCGKSCRS